MEHHRERLYRTDCIIIRRIDLGEADRVLTLYTPRRGKLRAIAKGVRRPESHLGGNLELFVQANVLLAKGRDLDIVTQAEMLDAFKGMRSDLVRLQAAFYFGELLDGLAAEELPNEPAYALLRDCLAALAAGADPAALARFYEFRLLGLMGYRLEVGQCLQCRRPLEPVVNALSIAGGGVLCPACQATDPAARPLSVNALKVLRLIIREPLAALLRYRLPAALQAELEAIGHAWVREPLEREPRSWAAFTTTLREAAGPRE
jgi:DNA repair protein RecO (recombination protein O)